MKIFSKIYKWVLLSIILQTIILSYFNFYYLNRKVQVVATNFDFIKGVTMPKYKAKLPLGADNIKLSFEDAYVGYILDGSLEVLDLNTGLKTKTIKPKNVGTITYYKWLPDRDIIIYAVKEVKNKRASVEIITYDIASGNEKTYPKISIESQNGGETIAIELSSLTNVVYAMVKDGNKAEVYRFNIMEHSNLIFTTDLNTVIKETVFADNLVYSDEKKNIFTKDGKTYHTKQLPFAFKATLLKVDNEDRVFVGGLDDTNKVNKVLYGKLTEDIGTWTEQVLKNPLDVEDIIISYDGRIYQKSRDKNQIINIKDNKTIKFEGGFIELSQKNIVSKNEDKLYLTKF
jgi:hypothetical protein